MRVGFIVASKSVCRAVPLIAVVWMQGLLADAHGRTLCDASQVREATQRGTLQSDQSGRDSEGEPVPKAKTRSPLATIIEADRESLERRLGYGWCDERWMDVLKKDSSSGEVAAGIVARNNCANLDKAVVDLSYSTNPKVRARTAIILGRVEVQGAASHLVRLIDDADEGVVCMALRSLCRIDPVSCREEAKRILILDTRARVRRQAKAVESDLDIGRFDKCGRYALRVAPEREVYPMGEALAGTISIVNDCPGAIAVAKPLLPSVWRVRLHREGAAGEATEIWQGTAPDADAISDEGRRLPSEVYQTIQGGESFGKQVDFREYLARAGVPIQEGCYGVRFWYKHELLEEEGDPLLERSVLVSDEVRICIVRRSEQEPSVRPEGNDRREEVGEKASRN